MKFREHVFTMSMSCLQGDFLFIQNLNHASSRRQVFSVGLRCFLVYKKQNMKVKEEKEEQEEEEEEDEEEKEQEQEQKKVKS